MIHFYDNPKTGTVHFRATSGGGAGPGQSGVFDAPATKTQIEKYPKEYSAYLELKAEGPVADRKNRTDLEAKNLYILDLETQVARHIATIERLNARLAELEAK